MNRFVHEMEALSPDGCEHEGADHVHSRWRGAGTELRSGFGALLVVSISCIACLIFAFVVGRNLPSMSSIGSMGLRELTNSSFASTGHWEPLVHSVDVVRVALPASAISQYGLNDSGSIAADVVPDENGLFYGPSYSQYDDEVLDDQLICFPGEALAEVRGRGRVPMDALHVGSEVLVHRLGQFVFEPVLAFLHMTPHGDRRRLCRSYTVVRHVHGDLRVSDHHLVFASRRAALETMPAAFLRRGDDVLIGTAGDGRAIHSTVQFLRRATTNRGMFAPLTAAGTIVVDGVVASVYAGGPGLRLVPHTGAHAAFFFLRAYRGLVQSISSMPDFAHVNVTKLGPGDEAEIHPFVEFLVNYLHLDIAFATS
eukprot:TRINITY_DN13184_c0_g1_i1.p1 TRINITY_DN13184_c0_g1~~TRINITY_DN13184_c0_g1_i1.p1  ORF type:complete len:368 (+),score=42.08 TRINITY_DN13184_c0_g1_i1:125-1228(+)